MYDNKDQHPPKVCCQHPPKVGMTEIRLINMGKIKSNFDSICNNQEGTCIKGKPHGIIT